MIKSLAKGVFYFVAVIALLYASVLIATVVTVPDAHTIALAVWVVGVLTWMHEKTGE